MHPDRKSVLVLPSWIQENSRLELRVEDGAVSLGYQIYDGRIPDRQQDAELTLAAFCALIRHAVGPAWRPREIHFEHCPGAARRHYQRIFGTSVFFDQPTNAVLVDARSLSTPMVRCDADTFDRAARFLQDQLAARSAAAAHDGRASAVELGVIRYVIESQCKAGDASIGAVARRMGMTVYRLRCGLKALQAPFDELVSEVRRHSRAFKAWTGTGPSEHRRAVRR